MHFPWRNFLQSAFWIMANLILTSPQGSLSLHVLSGTLNMASYSLSKHCQEHRSWGRHKTAECHKSVCYKWAYRLTNANAKVHANLDFFCPQKPELPKDNPAQEFILLLCPELGIYHREPCRSRGKPQAGGEQSCESWLLMHNVNTVH